MAQQTPPPPRMMPTDTLFFKVMNGFMKFALRSPLHGMMSQQIALITVTGRKSGKIYTTPINYVRIGADHVHVFTHATTWWKNLRGGAPVTMRMAGKDYQGTGIAIEDRAVLTDALYNYMTLAPSSARAFGTRIIDGKPVREDVIDHADLVVMIDITLDKTAN